jgi:hypothetical protein
MRQEKPIDILAILAEADGSEQRYNVKAVLVGGVFGIVHFSDALKTFSAIPFIIRHGEVPPRAKGCRIPRSL